MADLFNNLSQKFTEVASDLSKKTEETIEVQKIKSEVRSLKRANDRDFKDIGLSIYEKFVKGEAIDESFLDFCKEIAERDETIERKEEEIVRIQGE